MIRFYEAFRAKDGNAMARCYGPEATFSDPVFPQLKGPEVGGMWKMLCNRSQDIKIDYHVKKLTPENAIVEWNAYYTFSKTGRKVHNRVSSHLQIKGDHVISHIDTFDFYAWSRQAFGLLGVILGRTRFLKNKVRKEAANSLHQFLAKH